MKNITRVKYHTIVDIRVYTRNIDVRDKKIHHLKKYVQHRAK